MSAFYRILFVLCLLPFLAIVAGCSTSLRYIERESSIDKEERANGWASSEGNHDQREHYLAANEILCRPVNAKANEGYLVQIVNYSSDQVSIQVKRRGLSNPVTASFLMRPMSTMEYRLPTGEYDVHCEWNDRYSYNNQTTFWDDVKTVRTSPVFNNTSGEAKRYHAVIGNVDNAHRHYYQ
jgi:hypothetical protein